MDRGGASFFPLLHLHRDSKQFDPQLLANLIAFCHLLLDLVSIWVVTRL